MRWSVVCLLGLLTACHGDSVSAPETPDLSCENAIAPPTFRTVLASDTTTWTNRYAIPHRTADTVHVGGSPSFDVIATHGGRCTTLRDSLIIWHGDLRVIS